MADTCQTVKVKPWSADQGDFVEINEADFDAAKHSLIDAPAHVEKTTAAATKSKQTVLQGK